MSTIRGAARLGVPAVLLGMASSVSAQRTSVSTISDAQRCATCELSVSHLVSLGDLTDPYWIDDGRPSVERDASGRFLVASTTPRTRVLVYDSVGEYLTSFGRSGNGPGEFRSISRIRMLPGDSVIVIDRRRRWAVWGANGEHGRTYTMPLDALDVAVLSSDTIIASGIIPAPQRMGRPLHAFTSAGEILHSFGGESPVVNRRPSMAQRVIAGAPGGVWSARPDRYELEHWTSDGTRTSVIERQTDWFPHRDEEGAVDFRYVAPSSWLIDMHVDANGWIRVLSITADEAWEPSPDIGTFASRDQVYDTILEILDPERQLLLASARFPWYADGFTSEGLIFSHREASSGIVVLDIWSAEISNPHAGRN